MDILGSIQIIVVKAGQANSQPSGSAAWTMKGTG
jgi:hypothetical protein